MNAAHDSARRGKRILILDVDLFIGIGDSASTYRKLIEAFPENTYCYFRYREPVEMVRPPNVRPIPCHARVYDPVALPETLQLLYADYLDAWRLAAAVRNDLGACAFDVVDGPDCRCTTLFIRTALAAHGINCETVVLALHGSALSLGREGWSGAVLAPRVAAYWRLREHLQYRCADVRYAVGEEYAAGWARLTGIRANMLDPLCIVPGLLPVTAEGGQDRPDLIHVGARGRNLGPDLFVDLAWCLPPAAIGRSRLIGHDAVDHAGRSGTPVVREIAAHRGISVETEDRLLPDDVSAIYRRRAVLVAPSRREPFNLAVLEALNLGCPTFVGRGAGVADWIERWHPDLSDLVLELDCSRSAATRVASALENYDGYRAHLVGLLSRRALAPDADTLLRIYAPSATVDTAARNALAAIERQFAALGDPRETTQPECGFFRSIRRRIPEPLARNLRSARDTAALVARRLPIVLRHPRRTIRSARARADVEQMKLSAWTETQLASIGKMAVLQSHVSGTSDVPRDEIAARLAAVSGDIGHFLVGRIPIFANMARLELALGNDLTAATYHLRIMRWMGRDVLGQLGRVTEILLANGFAREAEAASAMFADRDLAHERCRAILEEQYCRQLEKPSLPFALLDDRRGTRVPKVAVIASLYAAGGKLKRLLENIVLQTLTRAGHVEIVLVDSNSPTDEYDVFKAFAMQHDVPIVFARSQERETIQAAWNRGIKLARAPYLCFYGVDEGMHPECLGVLADVLDKSPQVDWVMADSIVTNVDNAGVFCNDVLLFDRSGFDPRLVYLDTVYLNWVGGMYRRSIHDRFGYYDETFRAAGDTEFKLRVAPHVTAAYIPRRLGVFNNYPEARATENPRAEIEDLRAWYLPRTAAGMALLFDGKPTEDVRAFLCHALLFRRTYLRHQSTDFDLAHTLAQYMVHRGDDATLAFAALASTEAMLGRLRRVDTMDASAPEDVSRRTLIRALKEAQAQQLEDQRVLGLEAVPRYEIFNDDRFEHHHGSWSR